MRLWAKLKKLGNGWCSAQGLGPSNVELFLRHTHRALDGEGDPRGSLSIHKGML